MKKVLEYLTDLTNNNDREWYHANKEHYKQANTDFDQFISDLIIAIGEFDNSVLHQAPKDLTFKLPVVLHSLDFYPPILILITL